MKNTKKFAAMIAALTLSACSIAPMAMTASAASIAISGISESQAHTFEVYQVFTGDLDENNKFTNLKWGSGVTSYDGNGVTAGDLVDSAIIDALGKADADAREFAKKIVTSNTRACDDVISSGASVTIDGLDDGYYIVKDVSALGNADDANSAYIVQVAGTATINIKNAKPTVDKQVWDEIVDAEAGSTNGWGESADHAINESFKFKLKATIPVSDNLAAYDTYKLVFNDTMSSGVTFDSIESVKLNGTTLGEVDLKGETPKYTETATSAPDKAGLTWALTIDDLKQYTSKTETVEGEEVTTNYFGKEELTVEVIYNAHLNEKAVVDKASQAAGTPENTNNNNVYLEYSNNPDHFGAGGTTPDDETGETPKDYVWVFTYEVDNTKYELEKKVGNELEGAKFSLHTGSSTGTKIDMTWNAEKSAYMPKATDGTAAEYMESQTDGTFNIMGLDAGTYYLVEDEAPSGYNTVQPIEIVIGATHSETDKESENVTMTLSDDNKNMVNDIVDTKTSSLPSTGGIGTKLFYLGGGAMVAVAGVFLITKKRMGKSEN